MLPSQTTQIDKSPAVEIAVHDETSFFEELSSTQEDSMPKTTDQKIPNKHGLVHTLQNIVRTHLSTSPSRRLNSLRRELHCQHSDPGPIRLQAVV